MGTGISKNCPYMFTLQNHVHNPIDNLKLGMAYVLCEELQSAQPLEFQTPIYNMFYTLTFHNLKINTRVELNMFFTIVVVVAE